MFLSVFRINRDLTPSPNSAPRALNSKFNRRLYSNASTMSQKASQSKKESISCKLLILGDEKVGKTTLLKRLESGNFVDNLGRTDIDPSTYMLCSIRQIAIRNVCLIRNTCYFQYSIDVRQLFFRSAAGIPDFFEREFEIDDKTIKLQVWDTAGHERFNSITTQYFRSVQVSTVLWSPTRRQPSSSHRHSCSGDSFELARS